MPEDDMNPASATDTGDTGSAPADTQVDTAPASDTSPDSGSPAASSGDSSLPTDQPSTPEPQQGQPPQAAQGQPDWSTRYRELQSYADRRHNQYQQHLTQMQQELAKFKQQAEQQAKVQQAKPWEKAHPEHAKFGGLLERAKAINRQIQAADALPDENARTAAKQAIMAAMSPEEQQALSGYREHVQDFQHKLATDPETALAPIMERMIQQTFQKHQEQARGQMQVEQDFNQPHLKPILENPQYAGYLQQKLSSGVPYEAAMEMMKLQAAVDIMHAKLNGSQRAAGMAQEQTRLAKGRASTTVAADPAAAPVDPYIAAKAEAAKLGIQPGTPQFNRILLKHTAS